MSTSLRSPSRIVFVALTLTTAVSAPAMAQYLGGGTKSGAEVQTGRRWRAGGGDYFGFAAAGGSDDRFHVMWADSRTGVFQVWTSEIRIERP